MHSQTAKGFPGINNVKNSWMYMCVSGGVFLCVCVLKDLYEDQKLSEAKPMGRAEVVVRRSINMEQGEMKQV